MNKIKSLFLVALSGAFICLPVKASITCIDTVNDVIVHSNGRIFFTTPNACSLTWCELAGDATFKNQGYAMLMTAKIKGRTLYIQWANLVSCDAKNEAYTIPDFIILK